MKTKKIIVSYDELLILLTQLKTNEDVANTEATKLLENIIRNSSEYSSLGELKGSLKVPLKLFMEIIKMYIKSRDIPLDLPDDF